MTDDRLERHYDARDRYVQALGVADKDLLAPLMNPSFMGGPRWPALRESWRRIRRGANTILISDGLSDPFDEDESPNVGLGVEVLVETSDQIDEPIAASWPFDLVYAVSQQAADSGVFRELRDELGLFSMELQAWGSFRAFASTDNRFGIVFGIGAPDLSLEWRLPAGLVRVITAKLLFPSELAFVRQGGEAARSQLQERFVADGSHHLSSAQRTPVA